MDTVSVCLHVLRKGEIDSAIFSLYVNVNLGSI